MIKYLSRIFNISETQLQKYSSSSFWMIFENVCRLGVNLVVSIWLARYLGPSQYGLLNFGIAVVAIFLPIVNFGLQGILVKELFQSPTEKNKILGTSFLFKIAISIPIFLGFVIAGGLGLFSNSIERNVVLLIAISILFQPFLVIDCWFQSAVKVRLPAIIKTGLFLVISLLKILMILWQEKLAYFALLYSVEVLFTAMALLWAYNMDGGSLLRWKFDWGTLKSLVSKSWLLMFSSLSAIIYLKIDQVMLGIMVSDIELGIYSAAVKLSESWYFIPLILSNALFPAILEAKNSGPKKYMSRLQQLSDVFFLTALFLALATSFLANYIIDFLYGFEYYASVIILKLHIWAALFIFLRAILSKWLIAEDMYRFSLISQLSGAVVNVVLNYFLIPAYGGLGAAIATVISYAVTSLFILALFKKTRGIFFVFLKSFTAPIRIMSTYEKFLKKD